MSELTINETTDRWGRPLAPRPTALRAETDPVGVHIVRLERPAEYRWAKEKGAGVDWYDRHAWKTEHVLQVAVPGRPHARWGLGYLGDEAVVNHGEGRARTQGRSVYMYEHSTCIAADPRMGTAAEIKRNRLLQREHTARVGDLVVLQCVDLDGTLVEVVAARIVPDGFRGSHVTLELVQR